MPRRLRFGDNVAILLGGEALSRGLNFLAFSRLARLLNLSGYGTLELAQAVLMFLTLAVDLGTGKIGTRDIATNRGSSPAGLVGRIVSIQLLLAVIVVGFVILAISFLPMDPTLARLIVGFVISLLGFPFLMNWFFQGQSQMSPIAVLQITQRLVFLVFTIILVHGSGDLFRVPWAEILAVGIAAIGYMTLMRSVGEPVNISLRDGCDLKLLREGLPIGGSQLVWACRMYLTMMLLAIHFNRASIAFFGAALRIVLVGQVLLSTYFVTLFPTISEVSSQPSAPLLSILRRSLRLTLLPTAVFAGAVTLTAPVVMRLVFGARFARSEAASTLGVLIWLLPILVMRRHFSDALVALRHQAEELGCSLFGLAVLVALMINLRPSTSGIVSGAWAMVISESGGTAMTWWRLRRHLQAVDPISLN